MSNPFKKKANGATLHGDRYMNQNIVDNDTYDNLNPNTSTDLYLN